MKIGQAIWNERTMTKICKSEKVKGRKQGQGRQREERRRKERHRNTMSQKMTEQMRDRTKTKKTITNGKVMADRQKGWKMMKRESGKRSERPWEAALLADRGDSIKSMQRNHNNTSTVNTVSAPCCSKVALLYESSYCLIGRYVACSSVKHIRPLWLTAII